MRRENNNEVVHNKFTYQNTKKKQQDEEGSWGSYKYNKEGMSKKNKRENKLIVR